MPKLTLSSGSNASRDHGYRGTSVSLSMRALYKTKDLGEPLLHNFQDSCGKPNTPYTWESDLKTLYFIIFDIFNIPLILLPLGFLSGYLQWGDFATFWLNFVTLMSLARVLSRAAEEVSLHTGAIIGGLLSATLGNAVEMILTVQSLRANLLDVVQGALVGSVLSNLLLVLGMAFFLGGLNHHVQHFNAQNATYSTSLLLLACLGFITPTIALSEHMSPQDILTISRLTAIMIGGTYCLFLYFQLGTHFALFCADDDHGLDEWPTLSAFTAILLLAVTTIIISFSSEMLVASIEGVSKNSGMSKVFIGVILLPIVGNAAEHVTALTVAIKNKPDLSLAVAVGSSTQIALFMVPFVVLAGWSMGIPMTLAFPKVSAAVLTLSILIVIAVLQDGESNWLEGVMLVSAYCIIAIAFWFQDPAKTSYVQQLVAGN